MDHDTNTCTLRQWPAYPGFHSAKGVIQVGPGTISVYVCVWGGGGGGVGGAVRFRSNTKSGGPLIVWHRAYSIKYRLQFWLRGMKYPEHPLWDT